MTPLPVDSLLPKLQTCLRTRNAVIVEAPPGSGKTTRIAPSLLDSSDYGPKRRVYLLQPRRVAAKATAQRIAQERNVAIGKEVGYQVRFDSKVSASTALVVATEGILLRRIAADPTIEEIGAVVLDEFHERSLNADLLLGMLRRIQQLVREDLKLILMSATLDVRPLEAFLDAPVLKTTGTLHPVEIKYRPPRPRQKIAEHVAETVGLTVQQTDGDMLVFLPGIGEISQTERLLRRQSELQDFAVMALHGSMPLEQQAKVLRAGPQRRIILSTNVAETSLTIEGIQTVIDSGQVRVLRFNPAIGLDRLCLEANSQSSATQRTGRAGRLESGACIRLWDEKSHRIRPQHLDAEIRRVDLASAVLQLYHWGERPSDFPWFEAPRDKAVATAAQLLEKLGALQNGRITELGRQLAQLPVSPRLARMLIESQRLIGSNPFQADPQTQTEIVEAIALVAALLSERDPFLRANGPGGMQARKLPPTQIVSRWDCDVTQRVLALSQYYASGKSQTPFGDVHRGAAATIRKVATQFVASTVQQPTKRATFDFSRVHDQLEDLVANALLVAFPDRLARRRKPGSRKGLMVGGRGVRLSDRSGVQSADLFLCIDVDDKATEANVRQACGVKPSSLPIDLIDDREEQFFNPTRKQIEARRRRYWGDLMLSEQTASISDHEQCRELLYTEASKQLASVLPEDKAAFHSWWIRMGCLRSWAPELELPKCDDALLKEILVELCPQRRSFTELRDAPWLDWLKARLTQQQQQDLERECPHSISVPSGSRIQLDYAVGKPPILSVRIQEIFSWTETPRIGFGRVPVLLHLLAPNFRPQQVTDDLASFWENTYAIVRKELKRRYPKHAWPEDPLTAKPECKGGRRRR